MLAFTAGTLWWCHLLPPLQGGYWGLYSPTGHPWHPRLPLPFVPRWGNRQRVVWWVTPVSTNPGSPPWAIICPAPSFLICLRWQIFPLSPTHFAGSMSPTHCTWHRRAHSNVNNQPPHSWSLMSISTVWTERLVVDFESSDQTPTFPVNDDLNLIINLLMPLHNAGKRYLVVRCCDTSGSSGELQTNPTQVEFYRLSHPEPGERAFHKICLQQHLWMVLRVHEWPLTSEGMCAFTCMYVQHFLLCICGYPKPHLVIFR